MYILSQEEMNVKPSTKSICDASYIHVSNRWAAAGFVDILLRCPMKLEVGHGYEKAVRPGVQA